MKDANIPPGFSCLDCVRLMREHECEYEGLKYRPGDPKVALLVADLYLALCQEIEQLSILPELR